MEQAFGGWCAGGHDVYCGLGNGDCDADVPGAVGVGGGESVVVYYEATYADACCSAISH